MYQLAVNGINYGTYSDTGEILKVGQELLNEYGGDIPVCTYDRPCETVRRRKPCYACQSYEQVCREYETWRAGGIEINAGVTVEVARLSLAVVPL